MELRSALRKVAQRGVRRSEQPATDAAFAVSDAERQPDRFIVIESCHSTWLFDTADRRFCRVLRSAVASPTVATDWRPYQRLVLEEGTDAFVVLLDASGTRLLRSWRHSSQCEHCGSDVTAEMSVDELRRVARA